MFNAKKPPVVPLSSVTSPAFVPVGGRAGLKIRFTGAEAETRMFVARGPGGDIDGEGCDLAGRDGVGARNAVGQAHGHGHGILKDKPQLPGHQGRPGSAAPARVSHISSCQVP